MPIPSEDKDLTLQTPHGYLNCRVAYLYFQDDKVLLHQSTTHPWWFVPGGRIQFGESTQQAVLREIAEELQAQPLHIEYAGLVENFFTMDGQPFHELMVFYRATFAAGFVVPATDIQGKPLPSGWFGKDELAGINLLPSFLKTKIFDMQTGAAHIIHQGG